jgi:hypothetical protein
MKKIKKICILIFVLLLKYKINSQIDLTSEINKSPYKIYFDVSAGLPISLVAKDAKNVILNKLNLVSDANNFASVSSGIKLSNIKTNMGGKFKFSYMSNYFKNDSLSMNLSLTSFALGFGYRIISKKMFVDLGMNIGATRSSQKLHLNYINPYDLFTSFLDQQANLINLKSKPIFVFLIDPSIHYRVRHNYSIYFNFQYNFAKYSKLGKINNSILFSSACSIEIGIEFEFD